MSWLHDGHDDRRMLTERIGAPPLRIPSALSTRLQPTAEMEFSASWCRAMLSINKRMDRVRHSLGLLQGTLRGPAMDSYAVWKTLHVTSAVLIVGNVTVTGFWAWFLYRGGARWGFARSRGASC
jgi:hypothetical protein